MDNNKQPTRRRYIKDAHLTDKYEHTPPPYKAFDYAFTVPYSHAIMYYGQYRAMGVRFLVVKSYNYYGNPEWAHFYDTGGFKHE